MAIVSKAFTLALLAGAGTGAAQPSFRALPPLVGHERSRAHAVSADGRFAAGYSFDENSSTYRAVRWTSGGVVLDLGELPGGVSLGVGNGVSAHGFHVVGESSSDLGGEGFKWQGGVMTGLGSLPGGQPGSVAEAVSADGSVVVGFGFINEGFGVQNTAFRRVGGGPLVDLGRLDSGVYSAAQGVSADGSVVVGYSQSDDGDEAFRWFTFGGMVGLGDLAGGAFNSNALGTSGHGAVVVGQGTSAAGPEAFRWTKPGGMVGLGFLEGGGNSSAAYSASADGSVVVGAAAGNEGDEAFIWDATNGMRPLLDVLSAAGVGGLTNWKLRTAYGVSADGLTIVGDGVDPNGEDRGWIATLAEACIAGTERASIGHNEQQGDAGSSFGVVSASGNQVAFASSAGNLVENDINGKVDVFVRNRSAGWTSRVSVATSGVQGNNTSTNPSMSADGRFVVFESDATNLVAGDTNGRRDIFLRDRQLGTTVRLSVSTNGVQANGHSYRPRISPNGRFIVFESDATNLVGTDLNGRRDIFLRDRTLNQTSRPSLTNEEGQPNADCTDASVSDDGLIVCFTSSATNLVAGDTNGATDVFLRNRVTGATARVSVGPGGVQGNNDSFGGRISGNGRYFAFTSAASNLAPGDTNASDDVFLRDRFNASTTRITMSPGQANGASEAIAISGDGRSIVYNSGASNLVAGDSNGQQDVFIHDNWTFLTRRASLGNGGQQCPAASVGTAVSADGRFVVFHTIAGNLVNGDTNAKTDVFLRDLCRP
jgi:probable HAF family extracellular repeat protein